jgi:hypothetical protein
MCIDPGVVVPRVKGAVLFVGRAPSLMPFAGNGNSHGLGQAELKVINVVGISGGKRSN